MGFQPRGQELVIADEEEVKSLSGRQVVAVKNIVGIPHEEEED